MNIYPELKKIAGANQKIKNLIEKFKGKTDTEGLYFESAILINGCKEKKGYLYSKNGTKLGELVDNDYYCYQCQGYCEDDYYGNLYFKTNVPGQFVKIEFAM